MSTDAYGAACRVGAGRPAAKTGSSATRVIELFMAGDISHAKQVIRVFCRDRPCCVTVTPTTYIYRGGEEEGFVVGFRGYPRFPSDTEALADRAEELGELLRQATGQESFMIVEHGGSTAWSTTRAGG